jgi:hypothetical protein
MGDIIVKKLDYGGNYVEKLDCGEGRICRKTRLLGNLHRTKRLWGNYVEKQDYGENYVEKLDCGGGGKLCTKKRKLWGKLCRKTRLWGKLRMVCV